MKITTQHLIDLAKKETLQRADQGSIVSGYLIGSVTRGNPLLGGTADIDLVLIHKEATESTREFVRLSHQIHLDISHHPEDLYSKPSELRVHPWLGPALCEPVFLHDPDHYFEWAQAGARGQFFRPDHAYARASAFLKQARQGLSILTVSQRWLKIYLRSLMDAANAVACLDRFPVSGRRLVLQLQAQADHFDYPDLYQDFMTLLGGEHLKSWNVPDTLAAWARAYDAASQSNANRTIPPCRRDYYLRGFQAMAEDGHAEAILWPLLQVWERVMVALTEDDENAVYFTAWHAFLKQLKLRKQDKDLRYAALGDYINQNAAWIEEWSQRTGA